MIAVKYLIARFRYALDNRWGYIWGKTHELWSAEKQAAYEKDSSGDPNRENSCRYGGKWDGHWVTDCSGLFAWAFRELGGEMAHGSNTMYDKYCVRKGSFSKGARSDRQPLRPGTALFTGNAVNKGHVGLYVGGRDVIEAAGTVPGVILSKVTAGKWKYWGELRGVDYEAKTPGAEDEPADEEQEERKPEPGMAVVTGSRVALREGPSATADILTRIDTGEQVRPVPLPEDWLYVSCGGKKGFMMKQFLKEG